MVVSEIQRSSADLVKLAAQVRKDMCAALRDYIRNEDARLRFIDDVLLSNSIPVSRCATLLKCSTDEAEKLLKTLMGWYGFSQIVDSADPIFQFGDLYDLFAI
jgi:hypothetical protein